MAFTLEKGLMIPMLMIFATLATKAMSRALTEDVATKTFHQWMSQHGRFYLDDMEKVKRLKIFKDNKEYIENFNNQENRTYKLSLNKFADLTEEEFLATYTGYKMSTLPRTNKLVSGNISKLLDSPLNGYQVEIPENLDWRQKQGVVTPIKDQGECGCCWAFSAAAAVEGITSNGVSISAQQLLDCVTDSNGCNGGWMSYAFEYIIEKQGIASEGDYGYVAQQQMCQDYVKSSSAQITDYVDVTPNDEQELKMAVARQPVSAAITTCRNFHLYESGVFQEDCGFQLNHAVVIVGYGTSENGLKYWLIKNSWGETWGENGYMRIQRDAVSNEGLCGIAMHASYPTLQSN